jgi:hypothetical protein
VIPERGNVLWRVRARDGTDNGATFDALVLPTDGTSPAQLGKPTRLSSQTAPFDGELPGTPLVLVVHTNDGTDSLIVECDVLGPDGARRAYGRVSSPVSVIVLSGTGIMLSGLPVRASAPGPQDP